MHLLSIKNTFKILKENRFIILQKNRKQDSSFFLYQITFFNQRVIIHFYEKSLQM